MLQLSDYAEGLSVVVLHRGHLVDLVVEASFLLLPPHLHFVVVLRQFLVRLLPSSLLLSQTLVQLCLVSVLLSTAHGEFTIKVVITFGLELVLIGNGLIIGVLQVLLPLLGIHTAHCRLMILHTSEILHTLLLSHQGLVY